MMRDGLLGGTTQSGTWMPLAGATSLEMVYEMATSRPISI